jgi:hypothetical protein
VVWTGNASTGTSDCFQLVAGNISLSGNFNMTITGCDDSVSLGVYPPVAGLVE